MKIFHCDKYDYIGVRSCDSRQYYAFRCTKVDFSPEVILVREAKMTFPNGRSIFYPECDLERLERTGTYSSDLAARIS